jgi:4-hydroxythreonine-4-phosphate dehydrogenase
MNVGVTLGDPAGIGPETVAKVLADRVFLEKYPFIPIGPRYILEDIFDRVLRSNFDFEIADNGYTVYPIEFGVHKAEYGELAMSMVRNVYKMVLTHRVSAIVTSPINKHSIQLAGYNYPGHTEYLGALTGTGDYSMMLAAPNLRVITVTTHLPIKEVSARLTTESVFNAIKNAHNACVKLFGIKKPIVAVCGLNPHAGDSGTLGNEEEIIIKPAIDKAIELNIDVTGPHAADSLFAQPKKFDIAVSMYHDQGLIPVKATGEAVNITLNLPVIRTSPAHGTAFDIAGKGIADESSLRLAIITAHRIASNQ